MPEMPPEVIVVVHVGRIEVFKAAVAVAVLGLKRLSIPCTRRVWSLEHKSKKNRHLSLSAENVSGVTQKIPIRKALNAERCSGVRGTLCCSVELGVPRVEPLLHRAIRRWSSVSGDCAFPLK